MERGPLALELEVVGVAPDWLVRRLTAIFPASWQNGQRRGRVKIA
jgi:hypothetical protein